jgi:hypothetical protein
VGFLPFPDFEPTTLEEFKVLGHIMTDTHRCTIAAVVAPRAASPTTACP